ncbi:MAG: DegT/DnrJ/EryC1/StrS aminotransferase family protein [Rhodospirillaceae bacterium]|nr:DegT/DnrJ/EryC1/StrS aminotransferase family protein [Rhodospirillaceae bacterium]
MWSRLRFDIGWSDLAYGAWRCLVPPDRDSAERSLEATWSPEGFGIACHSVRTGFDLVLRSLDLPPDSEILFSALNIEGMLKVVGRLGFTAVPVDVDAEQVAPRLEALERAITPRSRVLVVAHLLGARLDLDPVIAVARRHGLFLIEDCAQAFRGPGFIGHPQADVSMFSFGPLKTSTALGGALLTVRDAGLRARIKALQAEYPVQSRRDYAKRLARFVGLKLAMTRPGMALVHRYFTLRGLEFDTTVGDAVRNVARLGNAKRLRKRPSAPMLALLERRLRTFSPARLAARTAAGERLRAALGQSLTVPGAACPNRTHWVFTVLVEDPAAAMVWLRAAGFDASNMPRIRAVDPPPGRPDLAPVTARHLLKHLLVLPCYAAMPPRALAREAEVVKRIAGRLEPAATTPAVPAVGLQPGGA